jgi:WD40 repeat protein
MWRSPFCRCGLLPLGTAVYAFLAITPCKQSAAPMAPPPQIDTLDLDGHADELGCAAFSPDGKLAATGCYDKSVRVFDTATGKLVATFPFGDDVDNAPDTFGVRSRGLQRALAFSPDGKKLAAGGGDWLPAATLASVFDLSAKKKSFDLRRYRQFVQSVAFSPEGARLATASHDATVQLSDAATGKLTGTFAGHDWSVTAVAFAPDGKTVASACCVSANRSIKLWDAVTMRESLNIPLRDDVHALAFSPDGSRLAGVSNWRLRVWDARTGKEQADTVVDRGLFGCLAVSPDGKRIAVGGEQGRDGVGILRLYDIPTKSGHLVFTKDVGKLFAVTWVGDRKVLAVGNHGGAVKLVSVRFGED